MPPNRPPNTSVRGMKIMLCSGEPRKQKRLRCAAIVPNYGHMLQRTFPAGFIEPCLPFPQRPSLALG